MIWLIKLTFSLESVKSNDIKIYWLNLAKIKKGHKSWVKFWLENKKVERTIRLNLQEIQKTITSKDSEY